LFLKQFYNVRAVKLTEKRYKGGFKRENRTTYIYEAILINYFLSLSK